MTFANQLSKMATRTQEKKEAVLNLLSKGEGIRTACTILAIGRSTFYKWKKNDEVFAADVERILSSPEHRERIVEAQSRTDAARFETDIDKFMAHLATSGDRDQAARTAGMTAVDVEDMLDPSSKKYDEDFAARMAEHDLRHLWKVEDSAKRRAITDGAMGRFFLSTQLKEKYGKPPDREGGTVNNYWFSAAGSDRARNVLRQIVDGEYKRLPDGAG